jgi:hypothetical protein
MMGRRMTICRPPFDAHAVATISWLGLALTPLYTPTCPFPTHMSTQRQRSSPYGSVVREAKVPMLSWYPYNMAQTVKVGSAV